MIIFELYLKFLQLMTAFKWNWQQSNLFLEEKDNL